jgi:hypothetical protein
MHILGIEQSEQGSLVGASPERRSAVVNKILRNKFQNVHSRWDKKHVGAKNKYSNNNQTKTEHTEKVE